MSIPDRSRELQIVNAFPEALKAAKAEQLHSDPPEYLYHYTDVKGLIGILENDCFKGHWVTTDYAFYSSCPSRT